ncbi:Calpain clp-1 [Trichinella papuae]|uniref:Calpain clp-1 n=1 Tax=Trichinella papuae TaxID=268474 RepID=A0A0V1MPF8_9BILA|nr:Calpain clp-1 [Trichinella papuae]
MSQRSAQLSKGPDVEKHTKNDPLEHGRGEGVKILPTHFYPLSEEQENRFRDIYNKLDLDRDGKVNIRDLIYVLNQRMPTVQHRHSYAMNIMEEANKKHGESLSFADFVHYMLEHEQRLTLVFNDCDRNQDGILDSVEIKNYFVELGMPISDTQAQKIVQKMATVNKEGIGLDEFLNYFMFYPCSYPSDIANHWRHNLRFDIGEDSLIPEDFSEYEFRLGAWWQHLVAGATAGTVSRSCTAPLDRLKVFLQVHATAENNVRFTTGFKMLLKEGGLKGMWRGNGVNVKSFLKFNSESSHELSLFERFLAGSLAGSAAQTLIYPLEVLKTRLALRKTGQMNQGILHAFQQIYRKEGIHAFYRGYVPNLIGIIPYAGIDLAVYEVSGFACFIATFMLSCIKHPECDDPSPLVLMACGTLSSICGQLTSYPLALVRTRLQAHAKSPTCQPETMSEHFRYILQTEGFFGLYRGLTPNFLKVLPSVCISYVVYETVRKRLGATMTEEKNQIHECIEQMAYYDDRGYGDDHDYRYADEYDDEEESEECQQVIVSPDEFGGLIGNIASNIMKGGDAGGVLGGLAGQLIGGKGRSHGGGYSGGDSYDRGSGDGGGGGGSGLDHVISGLKKKDIGNVIGGLFGGGKGKDIGNILGGLLGKKKDKHGSGSSGGGSGYDGGSGDYHGGGGDGGQGGGYSGGGGDQISGLIGGLIGGKKGKAISGVIGNILGGHGGPGHRGEGANIPADQLKGGLIETVSHFIGLGAHRFFGIDPETGRILGAIAGNLIFGLGGKDNVLGQIGKIILDNIISGKFKRKVEPFIPRDPTPVPRPVVPGPGPPPGLAQDFYALRDECLQNKTLFEDSQFPASMSSLFFNRRSFENVEWMRPGEFCQEPQLFIEGHSRFDVIQGELGDCWLLAAAAALTLRDELFYRVVPPDQSFTENYAGIFHFQFWRYGKWIDVVIDDRLPVRNGKLLYMHSQSNQEFWSALLEKAYAKLHGSYEALKGGTTSEALEDFTGGLTELIDLHDPPRNVMSMVFKAFELGSLMGCSIDADPNIWEARMPNGLVKGHAYSITGVKMLDTNYGGKVALVRMRNPWGSAQEWNGAWSDQSSEWRSVPDSVKQEIELRVAHDGEFWMCFDDFLRNFEKLEICNLGPEVMAEIAEMTGQVSHGEKWNTNVHHGAWLQGQSAGGCKNFPKTFAMNPQYGICLTDADPDDQDDLCTCVFGVLQKYRRELRCKGVDVLPIGFAVFEADSNDSALNWSQLANMKSCARSPVFINLREVCGRFRLPPGNYVLIPSTYQPNEEGEFMVRIFTTGLLESQPLQG